MTRSQGTVRVRYLNDGRVGTIVGTANGKTMVAFFEATVVHLLAWEFEVIT